MTWQVKFIYSKKTTKFWGNFTFLLTTLHTVKNNVKILQNFVTFSIYLNFINAVASEEISNSLSLCIHFY